MKKSSIFFKICLSSHPSDPQISKIVIESVSDPMPNVYTSGWMWFARYYFAQSLKSTFFDNFSSLPLGAILFNFFRFLALFKADSFNHLTTTRFLLGLRHSTVKHGHKNLQCAHNALSFHSTN